MIRIIVVHGRGSKPSKDCKLRYVREVLIESTRRIDKKAGAWFLAHPSAIQLAYFADILRQISNEPQEPCGSFREPIDRLYVESQRCPTWLKFRAWLLGLEIDAASLLIRFLKPEVRRHLIAQHFADTMRYLSDHEFASKVRFRLQELLIPAMRRNERVMLISHSFGSVIAYDVLWKFSHMSEYAALRRCKIERFVTIGSPLGDKLVKERLLGWRYPSKQRYPTNIAHWINICARGDVICHDQRLADDFAPMLEDRLVSSIKEYTNLCSVYRGREGKWNPHKLYGYLILPEVGRLLADHLHS